MVDYISFSSFFYRINIFLSPRRSGVWFFILNIYFPRQYDITLYFPGGCFSINIEHFQVMNKYFLTKFNFHLRLRVSPHLTSVLVLVKKNNIYYFDFLSSIVFNKNPKTIGPRNKWKCVLYKTPMSLHSFHHWYWLVECCKPFLKLTKIQCNLGEIFTASYKIYSIPQLSPAITLMSGIAHDGGILQSWLFTSRSQNLVSGKLRRSGFWS